MQFEHLSRDKTLNSSNFEPKPVFNHELCRDKIKTLIQLNELAQTQIGQAQKVSDWISSMVDAIVSE